MFFELSKIVWLIIQPINLIALLVIGAALLLWIGKTRAARILVTCLAALFIGAVVLPVDKALLVPLEQRFPAKPLPARVDGIILLGGAQQPRLTKQFGQPALNGAAETLTTFLALVRRYPRAKLVFSGGSGDLLHQELAETDTVKLFLEQQGFDKDRVLYESKSRNTYENALLSKPLAAPKPGETWLLIASAASMPRAAGVFRKQGWPVVAVPCDYNALPSSGWEPNLALRTTFEGLSRALYEWIGLVAYYVTGKTSALFPGP